LETPRSRHGTPIEYDPTKHPAYAARKSELLHSQAILNSFGKLLAQAYMLGFDQFTDLGYPLASQTVLCNGVDWSFHSYQLNTIQLDQKNSTKNPKQNYCWSTPPMKLIEENGKLNPTVLETLLKFYLTPTLSREGECEKPYVKYQLDDLKDDWRREFILFNFHELYSLRRYDHFHNQHPEIYNWERIYKIKHDTRPQDARKRFFMIPGDVPYYKRYLFKEPRYRPKRLKFLEAELENKKEAERVAALKHKLATQFTEIDDLNGKKTA